MYLFAYLVYLTFVQYVSNNATTYIDFLRLMSNISTLQ